MTTMLDKCAVAGDITQGIDRRGVWTAAITVIGGTSETAVKLVSSDTVDGEYTDFKTLISAADADTDQYKGVVVDLHGAKTYIKVTGATMATAVFGDCDHDVKDIAITAGEVPSGADLENNKEVEITENGEIEITPSAGKNGMKKVTATVNVPSDAKEEQTKSVTITENGTTTVTPDSGKVLSSVSITTNVSGGGSVTTYYAWGSLGRGYTVTEFNLGLTAPTVDSVVNLLKTSTTQSYIIYLPTNAPAVGDSLPIYAYGKGTSIASSPLIVTAVNANEGSLTGTIDGDSVTLWCKSIVGPDSYLTDKYTLSYLPKIKGVEPITYSANGTYTIPSASLTWLNDYDGCGSASVTVDVPASAITHLNTSAEIPATVGASQTMSVNNPTDKPVSLVYIQTFANGQGGSLSHSVSIADIVANGSATLELQVGPGKLTCTVTAVVNPSSDFIDVTFEIASVASDYFGGSIRGVVV